MNLLTCAVFILAISAYAVDGRPHPLQRSHNDQPRLRRRSGDLNATQTPQEYMRALFEEYADEEGKPRHGGTKPTDVWCFPDRDIVKQAFREKPQNNAKCTTYTQYVFQWTSMSTAMLEKEFEVSGGILRAYIQVIPRHVREEGSVDVTLTIKMNTRNASGTWNQTQEVFAGEEIITITRDSDQWLDLNVTKGITAVWPRVMTSDEVQITIQAEVNCVGQKKVPINFINPAEIPLDQNKRRERHLEFQPFLVVFADHQLTKTQLMKIDYVRGEVAVSTEGDIFAEAYEERQKRTTQSSHCSLTNYSVNLHALGLTRILAPVRINIYKCSGSCSHSVLRRHSRLGTNHAKIMASLHFAQSHNQNVTTAIAPCCVPTEYDIVYLFFTSDDGSSSEIRPYNNFKAKKCGCR